MQDYEKDWPGLPPIKHLVLSTADFVVFLDEDLDVDWETKDAYDQKGQKDESRYNEMMNLAASIECIPCDHLPSRTKLHFKRLVGEAVARTLGQDYDRAQEMSAIAKRYVTERNRERSRFWYLSASGIATVCLLLSGVTLWWFRKQATDQIGELVFVLALAGVAGALGAQLSIIMRMGKSQMDCAAGKGLHYLEAVSRIAAGVLSAILTALAVHIGILVPIFSKVENTHVAMVLAGLIAGASERLAPSIISHAENIRSAHQENSNE